MMECGMNDMNNTGCRYTWNNKQRDNHKVFSKIDRVIVIVDWVNVCPSAAAHFMHEGNIDHTPIIINVYPTVEHGEQPFKYSSMWSSTSNFQKIIADCWRVLVEGQPMFRVVKKLIKISLKKLNVDGFNDWQIDETFAYKKMIACQKLSMETQEIEIYVRLNWRMFNCIKLLIKDIFLFYFRRKD